MAQLEGADRGGFPALERALKVCGAEQTSRTPRGVFSGRFFEGSIGKTRFAFEVDLP
jgi:hypothetical protein